MRNLVIRNVERRRLTLIEVRKPFVNDNVKKRNLVTTERTHMLSIVYFFSIVTVMAILYPYI